MVGLGRVGIQSSAVGEKKNVIIINKCRRLTTAAPATRENVLDLKRVFLDTTAAPVIPTAKKQREKKLTT